MTIPTSFTGNLVDDPTLRSTPAGHAVTNFRVAITDRYRDPVTLEWKDNPTTYLTVTAWRRLAENIAETVHKGDQVLVVGRLRQREYETEDHTRRTTYEVEADAVGLGLAYAAAVVTRNPKAEGQPS